MADTKSQLDKMTKTPIKKLIVRLAIPTVLSMLVTTVYNLVDTEFVGRLGTAASGAVSIVFGFMAILQAVGFMFGQGSGSLVSRSFGSKDKEKASRIASTGFFCSLFMGAAVAIICACNLDPLIRFLGSTDTIAPYAKKYIIYILITAPLVVSSFTLNNILRFEGKAALGMIGLMAGGVLNIGGDALFMFVFDMGIAGAGLSTAISQTISFLILLSVFLAGKTESKLSIRKVSVGDSTIADICTTGLPSLLRQLLGSVGTVVLNRAAKACALEAGFLQDSAVSAMGIVNRISFLLFAIALGIGQGFQPVCGFNFGAKKYGRLREGYRFTLFLAEAVLAFLTIFVFIFSPELVRFMRNDDQVVEIGTRALRLVSVAQIFLPFCMVTEMLMQSSGKRLSASILSCLRGGLLFIPALWILSAVRGLNGVEEAQPLAYLLSVPPALFFAKFFFDRIPETDETGEGELRESDSGH